MAIAAVTRSIASTACIVMTDINSAPNGGLTYSKHPVHRLVIPPRRAKCLVRNHRQVELAWPGIEKSAQTTHEQRHKDMPYLRYPQVKQDHQREGCPRNRGIRNVMIAFRFKRSTRAPAKGTKTRSAAAPKKSPCQTVASRFIRSCTKPARTAPAAAQVATPPCPIHIGSKVRSQCAGRPVWFGISLFSNGHR
jgi:hypothetical protein